MQPRTGLCDASPMNDDFPILAAVAANPTHPYALLEHLQALGLHVSRSTLYRRVEALAAQGWLDADDIRGESGHYERHLLASDPDVRPDPDRRIVLYTFRLVPPGVYRVSVRIAEERWLDVVTELVVTREGAFIGDHKLGVETEAVPEAAPELDAEEPEEPEAEVLGEWMDVNDGFVEEGEP